METIAQALVDEQELFGTIGRAHTVAIVFVLLVPVYYGLYPLFVRFVRRRALIRNPVAEEEAFHRGQITADQLSTKYAGNLSATSTLAALSVAMVLLFVVTLLDIDLPDYERAVSLLICLLMTVASVVMLFAHQLYDTIINPVLPPNQRFRLRRLGSNLNVTGIILFIVSMLLVVSMVSTLATIAASLASCTVTTIYIEQRLVPLAVTK